jgi:hypothetical protein
LWLIDAPASPRQTICASPDRQRSSNITLTTDVLARFLVSDPAFGKAPYPRGI